MTLAVDITDGRGLSNGMHHEFLPKKSKVMLYFLSVSPYTAFNQLYITNKTECFSSKVGVPHRLRSIRTKEDWPIVLQ